MAAPPPIQLPRELNKYKLPAERVVLKQRRHWAYLWQPIAEVGGGFIVLCLLFALTPDNATGVLWLALLLWVFVVLRATWLILDWSRDFFWVTDRRLINTTGIFTRNVAMMPLGKVTDMTYRRTIPGKILGYGTFIVESAGQDQALSRIRFVKNPDQSYQRIVGEIFRPALRRATDVRPPPGSGSALPVVEPDDVWWRR